MPVTDGQIVDLRLTPEEIDYLNSFLDAGDRAGFYMAYYAMVSSDDTHLGDSPVGKAEASLQSKISSFSGDVGAAAYISNRLLQEFDAKYPGIYTLSQQVAELALTAITDSGRGADTNKLISDQGSVRANAPLAN